MMKNVMYLELSDEQLEMVTGGSLVNKNFNQQLAAADASANILNTGASLGTINIAIGGRANAFNFNNTDQKNFVF